MDQTTDPQLIQEGQHQEGKPQDQFNVEKIHGLLTAKDDTSRFVGLALLKTLLDNSEKVRQDVETVTAVWQAISPKFLDRLIKHGSQPQSRQDGGGKQGQEILDLAVAVLHTFVTLLPEDAIKGKRAVGRISHLVACLVYSSEETTRLALETLLTLVSQPEGAQEFNQVEDLTVLVEIAPSHQLVLRILQFAWIGAMLAPSSDKAALRSKLDKTIGHLVSSFKGTDAVTLLEFLADLLRGLDPELIPQSPSWLPSLRNFIQNLVKSRPTSAGRAAWTNITATLLQLYSLQAPDLLFLDPSTPKGKYKGTDTPFSYVLISLLLVDLRATLPTLLSQLNSPSYKPISTRLSSAYTILSNFIGYLLRAADLSSDIFASLITPDLLLKLRKSISETMSLTVEYLRDRWDASVAGALGLHPDSRTSTVHTSTGSHLPLTWDAKGDIITEDPLIESAIMALAIWLREDDGEVLRLESAGLMDMYLELYRASSTANPNSDTTGKGLDFRRPILAALEGILLASLTSENTTGLETFLSNSGWEVLSSDMLSILHETSSSLSSPSSALNEALASASRGLEIIRILLPIAENEEPGPREDWLDLVTKVVAVYIPPPPPRSSSSSSPGVIIIQEFQTGVLQLATSLLERSPPVVVQKRYRYTMASLMGLAEQVNAWVLMISDGKGQGQDKSTSGDDLSSLFEVLDEVRMAIGALQGGL